MLIVTILGENSQKHVHEVSNQPISCLSPTQCGDPAVVTIYYCRTLVEGFSVGLGRVCPGVVSCHCGWVNSQVVMARQQTVRNTLHKTLWLTSAPSG